MNFSPTFFIDIDGVIIEHCGNMNGQLIQNNILCETLNKILPFFEEAYKKDAKIIFCTGRKESERNNIVKLMKDMGIQYDELIMGLPRGPRIVINDRKPDGSPTAFAVLTDRNSFDWTNCINNL